MKENMKDNRIGELEGEEESSKKEVIWRRKQLKWRMIGFKIMKNTIHQVQGYCLIPQVMMISYQ